MGTTWPKGYNVPAAWFEPDQEQVSDQGGPDLDEHRIPGGPVKSLDLQGLPDPFEKEFNLPTAAVKFGHLQGG